MKQINWSDHILNFLAVIIGVSMAFYVSDTADRNKQSDELRKITQSFIDELQEDQSTFEDYQIPSNEDQSKLIEEVLYLIQAKNKDSLASKIQDALSINSYSPAGVTFHSIVSSGKLDLFSDFVLRKDISNYYQLLASEAQARAQLQVDFYMDQILPWIVNETDIMNPKMDDVINDHKLSNILILYKSLIDNKTRHYKYMIKECAQLENKLKELISE
jgi:hypothetical protein